MNKISIMISSTVTDLKGERKAIKSTFDNIEFVKLLGVDPVNIESFARSSRITTTEIARNCDLYILILGKEFGSILHNGKSATEIEFDAAFRKDPTKILVFKKNFDVSISVDVKQQQFINRVCGYYSGYWRSTFDCTHELEDLVLNSFTTWLKERASIGYDLDYLDHFIRISKQMKPEPNSLVYYKLEKEFVELEYIFFNKSHIIQFNRPKIYSDFWGCISELQNQFERWIQEGEL